MLHTKLQIFRNFNKNIFIWCVQSKRALCLSEKRRTNTLVLAQEH